MPLGKYYCDYCDKQFQDTSSARKRHLQGLQHQRARALYYDSFKAQNQIQLESIGRGVCNHFLRMGFCQYGDSCIYIHPMPQHLQNPIAQLKPAAEDAVRGGMGISLGNLPTSLRPPPEGGYPSLPFVDWG
ncbi:Zinc finger matrin-type protein [Thalictrum thalictroides]|uniref:Zinc finger matrin-type protein n=1 Tax=Thalictrum thalictroides TaxID=46969 RepID=A0A7J6XGU3_THATH|nr:Zinc finger matrin-type protein [Thalictrum thalictroides]